LLNKPERAGTPNGGYITAPWSLGKSQVRPDAIRQLGKFAEFYACLSNAAIQFAPNSYEFMEKVLFASKIQAARDCLRSGYSMVGRQRKRLLTEVGSTHSKIHGKEAMTC